MLPLLLNQISKNKNEAEKSNQRFFWRGVIITLKAINIFVNISMEMKKKIEPDDESKSLKLVNK